MPIQFIFGWSKALVAVLCSLLLVFVIMCTQPFYQIDDHLNIDRTDAFSQYVINNASRTYANLTSTNMRNASIIGVDRSTLSDLPNMRRIKKLNLLNQIARQQNHSTINQKQWRNSKKRDNEFDKRQRLEQTTNIDPIIIDSQSSRISNMTKLNSDAPLFNSSVRFTQQLDQSNATSPSAVISTALASTTTIIDSILPTEFETHSNGFIESQTDHMHKMNCSQSNGEDTDLILSRTERSTPMDMSRMKRKRVQRNHQTNLFEKRIERSANLSLSKATKRIQLLIKGRFLQMLPNGVVNGTHDDASEYTILQRNTVNIGQIRLVGIATCLFLCMDSCGNLYSTREFSRDCVFNERLEHNFNYYTSTHHSTHLRTLYIALNRLGTPRKTHLPANKPLGKLSTYAKAFTLVVPEHQSEMVIGKRFGYNHVKHGIKNLCESGKELIELSAKQLVMPQCSSSSNSNNSMMSNSNVSVENSEENKYKQSTHTHIRHRSTLNRNRMNAHANVLISNCTEKNNNKKKKPNNASNLHNIDGNNNKNKKNLKKSNLNKKNGRFKHNHRGRMHMAETTIETITNLKYADKTQTIVPATAIDEDFGITSTLQSNEQSTSSTGDDY